MTLAFAAASKIYLRFAANDVAEIVQGPDLQNVLRFVDLR